MTLLRPELRAIVDELTRTSSASKEVALDALGEAIGSRSISYDEIDAMITAIERSGHHVTANTGGEAVQWLSAVLSAARLLSDELGRRPSLAEIALRAGLPAARVRTALMLAKVMQR